MKQFKIYMNTFEHQRKNTGEFSQSFNNHPIVRKLLKTDLQQCEETTFY